jgi:hypothetical protein
MMKMEEIAGEWEAEFLMLGCEDKYNPPYHPEREEYTTELAHMIKFANYIQCYPLIQVLCAKFAKRIQGMELEQIDRFLNPKKFIKHKV